MFPALQRINRPERLQRTPQSTQEQQPESNPGLPRYLSESSPDAGTEPVAANAGLPAGVEPGDAATPVAPDTCGTPEEEAHKERFRNRFFSALDFRPSAGFGKFDAYYWPSSSLMAVIVKMKFTYVQADDAPSFARIVTMVGAGQDVRRFFWSEAEKRQFARDYVQRVSDRWSFVHTLRSTKPCWPFIAWPHVSLRVVEDASDAHFDVTVHKLSSPDMSRTSVLRAENPGTPGWRGSGDLDSNDLSEDADFNNVDVARSERRRLERAVTAAQVSPIQFAHNSAVVQPPYVARLHRLAEAMNAKNPSDPAVPMVCNGFASADGATGHNVQLAEQRAEAVANELRGASVPQPLVVSGQGPVGAPNEAANRKVELAPSTSFEATYATNRFSAGEHEFGHALGLPDEYRNNTSGDLGAKQTAFINLARAAGVAPPDQWGARTSSQMSNGVDVLPRHYLTIWEALGHMTQPDITRDQWRID